MSSMGATFRQLRRGKHLSLTEVSNGIVTASFLSKYERGLTDISFSTLTRLLERINVDIAEFVYFDQSAQSDHSTNEQYLHDVSRLYLADNIGALRQLKSTFRKDHEQLLPLFLDLNDAMLDACIASLTQTTLASSSQELIINYLSSAEHWGFYELYLFGNSLMCLPVDQAITLANLMYKRGLTYVNLQTDNVSAQFRILNNLICACAEHNRLEAAQHFLVLFKRLLIHPRQFYETVKYQILVGMIMYLTGKQDAGLNRLQAALIIVKQIGTPALMAHEINYLQRFVPSDVWQQLREAVDRAPSA